MEIDATSIPAREAYQLMIASLVPRPIAWVSTIADDGTLNLAPFSYFGGVTARPPTVMVSIGRRRGALKDTARNLLANGQAVVHIPDRELAEAMVLSSAEAEPAVDEFALANLETTPAARVRPPRIARAKIAFECEVERHLEIGLGPNDVFFLSVLRVFVADELIVDDLPDPEKLAAVGRLGGDGYSDTSQPFFIPRPR